MTLGKTDFIDNPDEVECELPGRQIISVKRYGKFMLLRLSADGAGGLAGETALLVHLGMTGMLKVLGAEIQQAKHTHVVMTLDDGRELRYVDPRRFGRMAYLEREALQKELERFGVDPLLADREEFVKRIGTRKARIKALLLDQSVLRGVGNIYADESLWHARIHPTKTGAQLRREKLLALHKALQKILKHAIRMRGSTIADFRDGDGEAGEYQQHHQAYGKEGQPCKRCRTRIRRMIVAGRSSFYCPRCQKK